MEFQITTTDLWKKVVFFIGLFVCMAGMIVTFLVTSLAGQNSTLGLLCFGVGGILYVLGGARFEKRTVEANEANFSRQLKAEYDATSNRSFDAMREDLSKYNEASAVFTQGGVDTQVFVKVLNANKSRIAMAFTVLAATSLYPKPSK